MSQEKDNRKRDRVADNAGPTPPRPTSAQEIPQTPGSDAAMEVQVGNDDEPQLPAAGASTAEGYDSDVSHITDSQPYMEYDSGDDEKVDNQRAQPPGQSKMHLRGPAAGGDDRNRGSGYAASSVSGDETVGSAATNFTDTSQASIASIASSVDQLPLPDAELMLFEVAEGVHRLTDAGMNLFNMVAERAGGYGPIASIAFISLLSANPNLLPTLSLPTIDLSGIASQIGLTPFVAQEAVAASAPGLFGFASNVTSSITSGITAGVTAIAAVVGTNEIIDNPLTIDHIASMIESAGRKAIGAAITVAQFQNRISTSFKKLKANWTVQNLSVEGISIRQDENIRALVERAVEAHGQVLAPADNDDVPRMNVTELRTMYNDIIREINNVAPTEPANQLNPADQLIVNAVENGAAAAPAPPAAGADRNTGGGKKNRKSQKKPRKKVTRSKRGKKAARKTKKQSRRKSRGKKHGKKH